MYRRKIKIKVYSKINLSLNILGTRDNMHVLDSVMTSAEIADVITVCERFDDVLRVDFSCADGVPKDNTAYSAAALLRDMFGSFGADIYVEKNIPFLSGLGGSSADAAGVITALDCLFDFHMRGLSPACAALKIGSDVPYMLTGGFARVCGTGAEVSAIDSACELNFVVARGKNGVSTKESFAAFDGMYKDKKLVCSDNGAMTAALEKGDANAVLACVGNALQKPSEKLNPEITQTLRMLGNVGAEKCVMTGSGAGCIGFFADFCAAEKAAAELEKQGLSAFASRSKKSGVEFL